MKIVVLSRARNAAGAAQPTGIKITNLPKSGNQRILKSTLAEFRQFITQTPERITFHASDGDIRFKVNWPPGRFCLTCGEELPDSRADPFSASCREHVKKHGNKAEKSDKWPDGYRVSYNSYDCTLED